MSIKIAHLSDSHFDERGRLQDVIDVHRAFLRQAKENEVDFIVHGGDWFERRSTPAERLAVANFLEESMHVAPVFGVKGNHDVELDLSIFPRLDLGGEGVNIMDRPTAIPGSAKVYWLTDHHHQVGRLGKIGLLALPWFDKSRLVAGLDATVDAEQTRQKTIAAAQDLLTCLRTEASRLRNEGTIPILVGHLQVAGSEVSTGQTLIGTTVELAPGDLLDVGAAYVALGHIHKSQDWFDGRVAYAGSPHRCNFGESEAKGWRLVTLTDEGEFVSNEFIELPARSIRLIEVDATTEADLEDLMNGSTVRADLEDLMNGSTVREGEWSDLAGALVRLRYRIRSQDLHRIDEEDLRRAFLKAGAAEVQLEAIVEHEARARAPEIVEVRSTAEKLDAWLKAKGIHFEPPQLDRLRQKLGFLEGGVS